MDLQRLVIPANNIVYISNSPHPNIMFIPINSQHCPKSIYILTINDLT